MGYETCRFYNPDKCICKLDNEACDNYEKPCYYHIMNHKRSRKVTSKKDETEIMDALFDIMWVVIKYKSLETDSMNTSLNMLMNNGKEYRISINQINRE